MLSKDLYSDEEFGLLNPAYVGFLLYSSVREFLVYNECGMHCALPYLVIPMSLNRDISKSLPSTYKTPIATWAASNEGVLSSLIEQSESYIPVVDSSISFLLDRNLMRLTGHGHYLLTDQRLVKNPSFIRGSDDMMQSFNASKFIGRWFSHSPSIETIFAQLGLRP